MFHRSRDMNVRRCNVARRSEKPQHAKGVSGLFRTYQNVGFLAKRPQDTTLVDFHRVGFAILFHRLTNAHSALVTGVLLASLSGPGRSNAKELEGIAEARFRHT
jgi:hypothetical protein